MGKSSVCRFAMLHGCKYPRNISEGIPNTRAVPSKFVAAITMIKEQEHTGKGGILDIQTKWCPAFKMTNYFKRQASPYFVC